MEVKIPFLSMFKEPMISGVKTWTSRTRAFGKPGDTFKSFGRTFVIKKVSKKTLREVAEHFREEGLSSEEELVSVWREIHPFNKGFNSSQIVFVHQFNIMEDG
jgi:hypothetical protein